MRILVGHNYYQQPGGEDSVFRSETRMLSSFGHEVCTYERNNNELKKRLALINPFSLRWSRRSYHDVRALIRRHRPDVAHFHNIFFLLTPSVYDACHDEGVPVVQSLHNFRLLCGNGLFFRDGRSCEDCLVKGLWAGVWNRCFRGSFLATAYTMHIIKYHWHRRTWQDRVNHFIVATDFTKKKYVDRGLAPEKISVKPHCVPDPALAANIREKGHALFIGRLSEEKGLSVLLKAWHMLPDTMLYVLGQGPMLKDAQRYISRYQLKNVKLLGFVNRLVYQDMIARAKVVIVPSLCYDNFPQVIVEAYAFGVPVVASRIGSFPEFVIEGVTGMLFLAGNATDLAQKVAMLMKGAGMCEEFGRNARKEYERKYTTDVNAQCLTEIYKKVLSQSTN